MLQVERLGQLADLALSLLQIAMVAIVVDSGVPVLLVLQTCDAHTIITRHE